MQPADEHGDNDVENVILVPEEVPRRCCAPRSWDVGHRAGCAPLGKRRSTARGMRRCWLRGHDPTAMGHRAHVTTIITVHYLIAVHGAVRVPRTCTGVAPRRVALPSIRYLQRQSITSRLPANRTPRGTLEYGTLGVVNGMWRKLNAEGVEDESRVEYWE